MNYKERVEKFRKTIGVVSVIAVDFDDVVLASTPDLLAWQNHMFGTNFTPADYQRVGYNYHHLWDVSLQEFLERVALFHELNYLRLQLLPDVKASVAALRQKGVDVPVLSYRSPELRELSEGTLHHHGVTEFTALYHHGYKHDGSGGGYIPKSQTCREKGIKILIEDNLSECIRCAEEGIWSLMFDHPWNQADDDSLPDKIMRVKGHWRETMNILAPVLSLSSPP